MVNRLVDRPKSRDLQVIISFANMRAIILGKFLPIELEKYGPHIFS